MPSSLREIVSPENDTIRLLAYDFLPVSRRVQKIWTFIETEDTVLNALASSADAGDSRVELRFPIVDARSATLNIGNEVVIKLGRVHAELLGKKPFDPSNNPLSSYLEGIVEILKGISNSSDDLDTYIRASLPVDLHLFYNASRVADETSIKVWSVYPELGTLLDNGPTECFRDRLRLPATPSKPQVNPQTSNSKAPVVNVTRHPLSRRGSTTNMQVVEEDAGSPSFGSFGTNLPLPTIEIRPPTPPLTGSPRSEPVATTVHPPSLYADFFASPNDNDRTDSDQESLDPLDTTGIEPLPPHSTLIGHNEVGNDLHSTPKSQEQTYAGKRNSLSVEYKPFRDPQLYQIYQRRASETFQLPDYRRRRFYWCHLGYNVMGWVPELMQSLAREDPQPRLHETLLHDSNFDSNQNVARHGKPHSRFMLPGCKSFDMQKDVLGMTDKTMRMSVFLPYLHWDSFDSLLKRSDIIERRLKRKHPVPIDSDVKWGDSMEHKIIWQYLVNNLNAPVHHRRSLDQYGYPNLRSTDARDHDQVLYKRRSRVQQEVIHPKHGKRPPGTRSATSQENTTFIPDQQKDKGKVLMVDQLWCWVLDRTTILTLFPSKEQERAEMEGVSKLADLRNSVYNDVNGDPRFATQSSNVFDFAALIVSHAVRVFIEGKMEEDLQVFRVFEEYLSLLTEQHTSSFKTFQARYGDYRRLRKDRFRNAEKLSKLQEDDLQANEEDLTAMLELRDIEDELNTISRLFRDQTRVISVMLEQYSDGRSSNGEELLKDTLARIKSYDAQVAEMQMHCRSAQEAFTGLLDMKQRQANLAEAWAAREATELASGQSRAVLIFTIFTIIFLPLSFFTSFFGMNVQSWPGTSTYVPLHVIILWMFPISSLVIVVALFIAFNDFVRQNTVWLVRLLLGRLRKKKDHGDIEEAPGSFTHMKKGDMRSALHVMNSRGSIMGGPLMAGFQWKGFPQADKFPDKAD